MELRALRYFVEVVRQQSFTAAAELMFVTQPTISKMVKSLEEKSARRYCARRASDGVDGRRPDRLPARPGSAGRAAQLQAELNDLDTLGRGELTIGIPPMGGSLFTPAIAAFRQRYPKIELKLFEQGSRAIETALINGELELGGVLQPVDPEKIDALPITRQWLWLVRAPARVGITCTRCRSPSSPMNRSCSTAKVSRSTTWC